MHNKEYRIFKKVLLHIALLICCFDFYFSIYMDVNRCYK